MSEPAVAELAHDADWRRLDLRMLLVHPVNEMIRFLPLLLGLFVLGSGNSEDPWHYLGVAIPIAVGLGRFATTSFRITGTQIELRRGLLSRNVLTAPLDRVRTVELTAKPIHRLLRLSRVEIGTGSAAQSDDGRLVLDSLGAAEARRLRVALLHRGSAVVASGTSAGTPAAGTANVIMRFDPAWVRYAPLTTSGLVVAVAAVAAGGPVFGSALSDWLRRSDLDNQVRSLPLLVTLPTGVLAFLIGVSVLALPGTC